MTLRPEQQRVLEYIRRHGTGAPIDSIRARMRETFGELNSILDGLPREIAARRPEPSRWSVQDVADHLIVTHHAATHELRALLRGERPNRGPIPAGLQSESPLSRDWAEMIRQVAHAHGEMLSVVEDADDSIPTDITAPVEMVVKCARPDGTLEALHWTGEFDWKAYALLLRMHTLEHIAQIRRILDAAAPQSRARDGI